MACKRSGVRIPIAPLRGLHLSPVSMFTFGSDIAALTGALGRGLSLMAGCRRSGRMLTRGGRTVWGGAGWLRGRGAGRGCYGGGGAGGGGARGAGRGRGV